MYKCKYFGIKELVSPVVYNKFGENSWMFFDQHFLEDLDLIRSTWQSAIIINSWASNLKQCGLRSNMDDLVKNQKGLYLSSHTMGKGADLHDCNNQNAKLHSHVCSLINNGKLKKIRRVENLKNTPTWVHVDCFQTSGDKLIIF